jgi:two-component system, cell cycle response regulator CpdR
MAIVLIVEDEDQVRVLAESYLREQGHQTVSAANAEEAPAVFEVVERIDVLFADINLHDDIHAWLEAAKRARQRQADLKVPYTTGQAVTDGMRAMMAENSAVLEKPYTVDQLQTALSVHFGIGPRAG